MTDLESTQANTIEQPQAGVAQVASPQAGDDVSALRRRLEIAEAQAKEARQEAAKYRTRNDEELQAKLKEQGDYKSLYEKLSPELESAKQKAERYDAWQAQQLDAVKAEASSLPSFMQKAVNAVGTIEEKLSLIQEYKAGQAIPAQPAPAKAPPMAGAPAIPPSNKPTVSELAATGLTVSQIRDQYPEIWDSEIARLSPAPKRIRL